ncbi:MAG: glycosyltransferase family 4 protein [Rhodoglobus sp.]
MTTLQVIIDDMLSPSAGSADRYTEELTRALITTAPTGCFVEAAVAASTEPEYERITECLPGLTALHKSALAHRELRAAWQYGLARLPGTRMVHAPSLLAPLVHHDRVNTGQQIAVTVHDTIAWSHPESLHPRVVAWNKAMLRRAARYADAVVVPSHTVAEQLNDIIDLGDRVRVISGAPSSTLAPPDDSRARAAALKLPERYILASGTLGSRTGIRHLIHAMTKLSGDEPLLLIDTPADDEVLAQATVELPAGRVRGLGPLSDPDLAVVIDRATVFIHPSLEEGFGMPMLEAFALGTPVVHSDAPALVELAAGAGVAVERGDSVRYPQRLAEAIDSVLDDRQQAIRLAYSGSDRANAFSWRGSAEKVWQLHADL